MAALVAGCVAMGCGSDSNEDPGTGGKGDGGSSDELDGGGGGGNNALKLTFSPMYSAYDGEHPFKLPVKVVGATGKLKVTTSPDGFVDSDPSTDGVMLTMRKAGKTMVTIADEAGNTGSAELNVTQATPADYELGKTRYNSGIEAFTLPEGGFMLPEGGFPEGGFPEGGIGITRNPESACTFCHRPDGAGGPSSSADGGMIMIDVEHTPQQTGGYSDEDIIKIFSEGVKPAGSPFRVLPDIMIPGRGSIAAGIYMMIHKWNVEDSVKKGIVTYLRGLEPKAQGAIDFGGLIPRGGDGGFMLPNRDAGTTTTTDSGTTTTDAGSDAGTTTDAGSTGGDAGADGGT